MSGHSKWSTIKRAKETKDSKRSNLFTKLSRNIIIAAKAGADLDTNFKLKMAVDKAKSFSMPKDSIERAIKRGSGGGDSEKIESLVYEAYGPEGVAIIMDVLTDNKNRVIPNIKHILSKHNGKLGSNGSVMWMFEFKGEIVLNKKELSEEEELDIIENGAEDIIKLEDEIKIITSKEELEVVKNKLQAQGFDIKTSELSYLPKEKVMVAEPEKLLKLLSALDDDDDVNNLYTNADI